MIDWYLMRPTVGIEGVCPPMCSMSEINDGTYTITDIEIMNQAMEEMLEETIRSMDEARAKARSRSPR